MAESIRDSVDEVSRSVADIAADVDEIKVATVAVEKDASVTLKEVNGTLDTVKTVLKIVGASVAVLTVVSIVKRFY